MHFLFKAIVIIVYNRVLFYRPFRSGRSRTIISKLFQHFHWSKSHLFFITNQNNNDSKCHTEFIFRFCFVFHIRNQTTKKNIRKFYKHQEFALRPRSRSLAVLTRTMTVSWKTSSICNRWRSSKIRTVFSNWQVRTDQNQSLSLFLSLSHFFSNQFGSRQKFCTYQTL